MSNRLNLNDDISDVFQFTINGLDYDLHYPTLKELEPINDLNQERQKLQAEGDDKKLAAVDKQLTEIFYGFVKPVGHDTPIKDTLENSNIRIIQAFNKMVQEQLSGE